MNEGRESGEMKGGFEALRQRGGWRQMKAELEGRLLRGLGSRSSRESMMAWVDKKESRSGRKTEKRES